MLLIDEAPGCPQPNPRPRRTSSENMVAAMKRSIQNIKAQSGYPQPDPVLLTKKAFTALKAAKVRYPDARWVSQEFVAYTDDEGKEQTVWYQEFIRPFLFNG